MAYVLEINLVIFKTYQELLFKYNCALLLLNDNIILVHSKVFHLK